MSKVLHPLTWGLGANNCAEREPRSVCRVARASLQDEAAGAWELSRPEAVAGRKSKPFPCADSISPDWPASASRQLWGPGEASQSSSL